MVKSGFNFLKGISTKVNIIVQLEFEFTYSDVIVCLFGIYCISTFKGYLMPNPFLYK